MASPSFVSLRLNTASAYTSQYFRYEADTSSSTEGLDVTVTVAVARVAVGVVSLVSLSPPPLHAVGRAKTATNSARNQKRIAEVCLIHSSSRCPRRDSMPWL